MLGAGRMSLACLLLLAGCQAAPEPPLRIGTNIWAGNYSLHLAVARRYTGAHPVRLLTFPSATEVIRALHAGQLDAACITADEFLLTALEAGRSAPRAILVLDVSEGADAILARPPARSMPDLRGRKIGVESTALGALMLARALDRHGMHRGDITAVQVPFFDHERQYREGRVDAVVTFEPVRSRLLHAGAVQVFSSREIPGEVIDLMVATQGAIATRGPALKALLAGYYQALRVQKEEPETTAVHLQRYLRLDGPQVDSVMAGIRLVGLDEARQLLGHDPDGLAARLGRLAEEMLADSLLPRRPDTDALVSAAFLPAGAP